MKALAVTLAALVIFSSTPTDAHHTRFHHRQIVITNNPGGEIGRFERDYQAIWHGGSQVRIAGWCASACTMFLGLPDTCVYPNARFGFHQARDIWGNPSSIGTYDMTRHYPGYLRGIARNMPPSPGLAVYTGMDLIRMGARPCLF